MVPCPPRFWSSALFPCKISLKSFFKLGGINMTCLCRCDSFQRWQIPPRRPCPPRHVSVCLLRGVLHLCRRHRVHGQAIPPCCPRLPYNGPFHLLRRIDRLYDHVSVLPLSYPVCSLGIQRRKLESFCLLWQWVLSLDLNRRVVMLISI